MSSPSEFEQARKRVLLAEQELKDFSRQYPSNCEQKKRLAAVVRSARVELVDSIASLFHDVLNRSA